jgi:hypothetical protein
VKPYILFIFFFVASAVAAVAQSISGRITDSKTHAALPYVNIGVVGKALGTVADEQGAYQLPFQEALANATVRVSSLGYAARNLTLRELAAQPNLTLVPEAVALNEVRVQAKALFRRTHTLGNIGNSENTTYTLNSKDLGGQLGTVIKLSRRPTRLVNANFNIAQNAKGQATFRLNLYRLDAKGHPSDTKLLARDIFVTMPVVRGPVTVDLSAEKLVIDEDFFLAVEMVKWEIPTNAAAEFAFSASLGYTNNEIYFRQTSQAPWERLSAGAFFAGMQPRLSFFVTVND